VSAPGQIDGPGSREEARLVAALDAALGRGAARAEPVAVVVALLRGDERDRAAALEAARTELPPDGLAARVGEDRVALLLPGVGAAAARASAVRIATRCSNAAVGAAAVEPGGLPVGPVALLSEAEAQAVSGGLRPRILVVEDDPAFGEILEVFLRSRGRFDVDVARSGAEALAAVRARAPDLALLDLELPDVDGASLLARLREMVPHLPAIACSGKRPQDAAGAGFTAFHRKPLELGALVREVDGMLRRPDRLGSNLGPARESC